MQETTMTLTDLEREYLVGLLEKVLKDKRVEEHRTRTPSYRAVVLTEEDTIASLLTKLGKPSA